MLAIVDYEAGNQTSVLRGLAAERIPAVITKDAETLFAASGVIFPGVGAAGQAMELLQRTGMDKTLKELVKQGKPLLGVCLGCQILLESSEESNVTTLGLVKGQCLRFEPDLRDEAGDLVCIPHMGWNSCNLQRPSVLFDGIPGDAEFYFVHGYYALPDPDLVLTTTYHGREFCSSFGRDGLWGVQFHPEKSGTAGLKLLKNFYDYCRRNAHQ